MVFLRENLLLWNIVFRWNSGNILITIVDDFIECLELKWVLHDIKVPNYIRRWNNELLNYYISRRIWEYILKIFSNLKMGVFSMLYWFFSRLNMIWDDSLIVRGKFQKFLNNWICISSVIQIILKIRSIKFLFAILDNTSESW